VAATATGQKSVIQGTAHLPIDCISDSNVKGIAKRLKDERGITYRELITGLKKQQSFRGIAFSDTGSAVVTSTIGTEETFLSSLSTLLLIVMDNDVSDQLRKAIVKDGGKEIVLADGLIYYSFA